MSKTNETEVIKKNKVLMVEYQGRVDEENNALGHGPKVLNDYFGIIKNYCDVSVYAPKEILKGFTGNKEAKQVKVLPEKIIMGKDKTLAVKIKNKLGMFKNISLALKNTDAETVWFFNVEYYFFLYLFLHRRIKKRIVCTMFLDGYRGGIVAKIKNYIFEQGQKKLDVIIATGKQLKFKNCKYYFVPDYYCPDELRKNDNIKKDKLAVCLGTMGKGKQLKELVTAFNKMDYPLIIAGRFYDKALLQELRDMAGKNIEIRDEYLSDDEYKSLLERATFTVLPYSPSKYDRQTSGVMQEAVFYNTIPVSYNGVLDGNGIKGIGFDSWDELNLDVVTEDEMIQCRNYYKELRNDEYSEEKVKNFYHEIFGTNEN